MGYGHGMDVFGLFGLFAGVISLAVPVGMILLFIWLLQSSKRQEGKLNEILAELKKKDS